MIQPQQGERIGIGLILAAIFTALVVHADQPIVENYVGRQIPTAMVARNLDYGSGFLHPTLDTAPFPNQFLVEPPIYATMMVGVKHAVGFVWEDVYGGWCQPIWEVAGRLTSATMMTIGGWSFYGLVRRREGVRVALVALASFGILPVTLRYGRAVQPDATMLGFVLLGLRGWDEFAVRGAKRWGLLGGVALAVGMALKITSAWVLLPYFLIVPRLRASVRVGIAGLTLVPACLWYGYAWREMNHLAVGESLASADNAAVWLGSIGPAQWVRSATWGALGRNLLVRAFTPIGFVLASLGWVFVRPRLTVDRLWGAWAVGSGLAILILAAKWHHGYYWLVVVPLAAVGIARALVAVGRSGVPGRLLAWGLGGLLVGLSGYQAASTWRTPVEWSRVTLREELLPSIFPNWILIAPEAVLYYSGRPGLRLEFAPEAIQRATREWGQPIPLDQANANPMALVDFYEREVRAGLVLGQAALRKHHYSAAAQRLLVIDVGPVTGDPRRAAWREALRRRPQARIWLDDPEQLSVELEWAPCPDASRARSVTLTPPSTPTDRHLPSP